MARFVLWGTYCDGALQKREPFRDEHLAGLRALKEQGTLITLGPTEGSTHVFAIFESDSKASVCALLEQDVYTEKRSIFPITCQRTFIQKKSRSGITTR